MTDSSTLPTPASTSSWETREAHGVTVQYSTSHLMSSSSSSPSAPDLASEVTAIQMEVPCAAAKGRCTEGFPCWERRQEKHARNLTRYFVAVAIEFRRPITTLWTPPGAPWDALRKKIRRAYGEGISECASGVKIPTSQPGFTVFTDAFGMSQFGSIRKNPLYSQIGTFSTLRDLPQVDLENRRVERLHSAILAALQAMPGVGGNEGVVGEVNEGELKLWSVPASGQTRGPYASGTLMEGHPQRRFCPKHGEPVYWGGRFKNDDGEKVCKVDGSVTTPVWREISQGKGEWMSVAEGMQVCQDRGLQVREFSGYGKGRGYTFRTNQGPKEIKAMFQGGRT